MMAIKIMAIKTVMDCRIQNDIRIHCAEYYTLGYLLLKVGIWDPDPEMIRVDPESQIFKT